MEMWELQLPLLLGEPPLWGHSLWTFLSIDNIFFLLTVLSQPVSVQGAEFSFLLMILKKLLRNQNMFQSYLQGLL